MKRKFCLILTLFILVLILRANAIADHKKLIGENWNDPSCWITLDDDSKSKINVGTFKGKNTSALKITYNIAAGSWALISKNIKKIPSLNTPIVFDIKAENKGNTTLEIKMVDRKGAVFGTRKNVNIYKDWTQIVILLDDLEYLWGGEEGKFGKPKEFHLAFISPNGGSGTVFIDNIGFGEPIDKTEMASSQLIWDSLNIWDQNNDGESIMDIAEVPGKVNKGLKITYQLNNAKGGFVQILKGMKINPTNDKPLTFYIKAEGSGTLQINFEDKNGCIFGHSRSIRGQFKDWTPIIITPDDIDYLFGGSGDADTLGDPKFFSIAVAGPKGTSGYIMLNQIGINTIKK